MKLKDAEAYLRNEYMHGGKLSDLDAANAVRSAIAKIASITVAPTKPLTDSKISWLWGEAHNDTSDRMAFQVFARATEAAHGIGGKV